MPNPNPVHGRSRMRSNVCCQSTKRGSSAIVCATDVSGLKSVRARWHGGIDEQRGEQHQQREQDARPSASARGRAARASAMPRALPRRGIRRPAPPRSCGSRSAAPPPAAAANTATAIDNGHGPAPKPTGRGASSSGSRGTTRTRYVENAPAPPCERTNACSGSNVPVVTAANTASADRKPAHVDGGDGQRPERGARASGDVENRGGRHSPTDLGAEFRLRVRGMQRPAKRRRGPARPRDERTPKGTNPAPVSVRHPRTARPG